MIMITENRNYNEIVEKAENVQNLQAYRQERKIGL